MNHSLEAVKRKPADTQHGGEDEYQRERNERLDGDVGYRVIGYNAHQREPCEPKTIVQGRGGGSLSMAHRISL